MNKLIQHYQTCSDMNCPLFDMHELNCKALKEGDCKYQNIHLLIDDDEKINQYVDDEEHGLHREYTNGQLEECTYKNGLPHGKCKNFYRNGKLMWEHTYVDGKLHGSHRGWDENGQLRLECNYVNEEKHGVERHWSDERLWMECMYVNGKLWSSNCYTGEYESQ